MTPSQPSAGTPTPDLVQQLLQQLDTQTKLARAAVRGMQRAMKQLEKERAEHTHSVLDDDPFSDPEPRKHRPLSEEEEAHNRETERRLSEDILRTKREYITRLFHFYPECEAGGHSPRIEAHLLIEREENLYPMTESFFRALLLRDFPPAMEKAYRRRVLQRNVYESLVDYCEVAVRREILSFQDEELCAKARELEEQEHTAAPDALEPTSGPFRLKGRTELEEFINREVVDIVNNHAAYRALGIDFPQSFVLEGPPGCGKTYAVEQLAKHLRWHIVRIDSSTIGSTYVHGTAKRIEKQFEEAEANAPSLVIIDEMDAFMPDRASCGGNDQHLVEEVASFLRRLQAAAEKHVLVVGMTNRKNSIDPALLRTGRFGAHLTVAMPSCEEVEAVLAHALSTRAHDAFPLRPIAEQLLNRPLSDITHLVDRAAMHTARHHRTSITSSDLTAALAQLQATTNTPPRRSMGFAA